MIGFDTEFVRNSVLDCDPEADGQNSVVTYQFCVLNPRTGAQASFWFEPEGAKRKNRISLGGAIGRALYFAEEEGLIDTQDSLIWATPGRRDRIKIALVAHFTRADLCSFRDFKQLKKIFDSPRGTYASTERPAVIDVRLPDRYRRRSCSVTLFDTKLLAPAGYGALAKLGEAIGFPKLKLPTVIDEGGAIIPGIDRMDLTLQQHPAAFVDYAIRDAEVAVRWFQEVAEFSFQWGVRDKIRPTLGALATKKILIGREEAIAPILGRELRQNPFTGALSIGDPIPEAAGIQSLCADAFHGGRNECHAVGIFADADIGDGAFYDWDEAGAYTTAMAHFRAIDWAHVEHTKDISRLAVCDPLTYATIDFEFPDGVKYPSLPVQTGGLGIIFPRRGTTTTVGPELLVALNQGCLITVRAGVVLNWLEEGDGLTGDASIDDIPGEAPEDRERRWQRRLLDRVSHRPFAAYAQQVNIARAKAKADAGGKKGSTHELMAKESGNSGFGKLGQAVCNMKSAPEHRKMFSSRAGEFQELEPSALTAPHLAAYTSGLPRALLSEIISRLPDDVTLLSCTTDGFLSSLTPAQIDHVLGGPVARHFASLRSLVCPKACRQVLELKHTASEVISAKTRGNFAIEIGPDVDGKPSDLICARAGHRLEHLPEHDDAATRKRLENAEWLRIYMNRTYDTKLRGKVFNSIREQFEGNADLINIWRDVRVNFDFDMKRRPIEATIEADPIYGMIRFDTAPWDSIEEFLEYRGDFDAWRSIAHACLKTPADWRRFIAWRGNKRIGAAAKRSPFAQWVVVAAAHGVLIPRKGRARNSQGHTLDEIAAILCSAGISGVTRKILVHASAREQLPDTIPELLDGDEIIRQKLAAMGCGFLKWKSQMQVRPQNAETHKSLECLVKPSATMSENLMSQTRVEGESALGHQNPAPLAATHSPASAASPTALDASDIRHKARMRRRLQSEFGIGRAALDQAGRRVPADLPGGPKAREVMTLVQALAKKLRTDTRTAAGKLAAIAAETAEENP